MSRAGCLGESSSSFSSPDHCQPTPRGELPRLPAVPHGREHWTHAGQREETGRAASEQGQDEQALDCTLIAALITALPLPVQRCCPCL